MMFGRSIYQIFLGLVASYFLLSGLLRYFRKEKTQTLFKLMVVIFIWGPIFVFSLFPMVPQELSVMLGLGENLNTLIFAGFVLVFVIIFKVLSVTEKLEREISEIVRREALSKLDEENNK